jgi:hypothetical protein
MAIDARKLAVPDLNAIFPSLFHSQLPLGVASAFVLVVQLQIGTQFFQSTVSASKCHKRHST